MYCQLKYTVGKNSLGVMVARYLNIMTSIDEQL